MAEVESGPKTKKTQSVLVQKRQKEKRVIFNAVEKKKIDQHAHTHLDFFKLL